MEILLPGVCATGLLAPIVSNQVFDNGSWRYFLILTLIPLVWITYYAMRMLIHFNKAWVLNAAPIVFGLYCLLYATRSFDAAKEIAAPTPMQECLEAKGLSAGIGEYWQAKKLIFASNRRIHVAQVTRSGSPYRWNFNKRWFKKRADDGSLANLNFIISEGLKIDKIRLRYGEPDKIVDCDETEIWLYDKNLHL